MEELFAGRTGVLKRREAREQAFCLLFEKTFREEPMSELMDCAEEALEMEIDPYAVRIALLSEEKQAEIDARIEENLRGWKLRRLTKVSLALLRLSVCEICFLRDDEVPPSVSINEAVELAKQYGTEKDSAYVNGVLASVAKTEEGAENA